MGRKRRTQRAPFLRRSGRGFRRGAARSRRLPLHLEQLEPRLAMDGAGFVHTDPPQDPESVVGVASIEARDDYVEVAPESQQLRIDALANDPPPEGSTGLRIKSISDTLRGATATISEDGTRIIYTVPESGVTFDSFYYIVEDSAGNFGKANVTIGSKDATPSQSHPVSYTNNDHFAFYEDGPEKRLNVLANDVGFRSGEIIAVEAHNSHGGTIRIADDGKALFYQPAAGFTGLERYRYTVRNAAGETATADVTIDIRKPFLLANLRTELDIGSGPVVLEAIARGAQMAPTPESPRIVAVEQAEHGGTVAISEDGQRLLFTPDENFLGDMVFSYTVRYGPADYQTVDGTVSIAVRNTFLAVDNWYAVEAGSVAQRLDVLANDPALPRYTIQFGRRVPIDPVTLQIVEASLGSQGGQVTIEDGAIRYTPAAGFTGEDTFSYVVEDSNGHRDSASVTVFVVEGLNSGILPRFVVPGELQQFLIDQSVERFQSQFGYFHQTYVYSSSEERISGIVLRQYSADVAVASFSQTNTQEAGVDEADIVETDGRYVYTFSHGALVIADLANPGHPLMVSFTEFADRYTEMYLQGDRLTLINRGGYEEKAVLTVLDLADRAAPSVAERTEIDGRIIDSRAVGDRVYIAVLGLELPELESLPLPGDEHAVGNVTRVYETLDQYVARVKETILHTSLPSYRTFDADGDLVVAGFLTDPEQIHKPVDDVDDRLLSLVTFDAGDDQGGPVASTGIFTTSAAEVYMSGTSIYVLRNHDQESTIFKFSTATDGAPKLIATGKVSGTLLNQFSVDEHEGRLRIATTQVISESYIDDWGNLRLRPQRRFNNLFILEQRGAELEIVGSVENLAPTETIKSVRFLEDRAYVITFRVVDPLFAIDLTDPSNPTVQGALKIPGFSDYLHPVGEDYVIGIGRDANEITGELGPVQISLFYVGDMANPTLVDQVTMEGAQQTHSEAWLDHHAVALFAEDRILTLPVTWYASSGGYQRQSAIWAFEIDTDGVGGGSIEVAGSVEHAGTARRSVRIGDSLITFSDDHIKVHKLHDLGEQLGELYVGQLPVADQFTIDEDSGEHVFDVLANDHPGASGLPPMIVSVTQPLGHWGSAGAVTIGPDGRSLIFTPAENFHGTTTFSYTVVDEVRGEETATVSVNVNNVPDLPDAVDDEFDAEPDSGPILLNVLANDINFDDPYHHVATLARTPQVSYEPLVTLQGIPSMAPVTRDFYVTGMVYLGPLLSIWPQMTITAVGPTDNGGTVEIDKFGQLAYTPAAGFVGIETFTYTVTTQSGLSDVATVTVRVGTPAESPFGFTMLSETMGDEAPSHISQAIGASNLAHPLQRLENHAVESEPVGGAIVDSLTVDSRWTLSAVRSTNAVDRALTRLAGGEDAQLRLALGDDCLGELADGLLESQLL